MVLFTDLPSTVMWQVQEITQRAARHARSGLVTYLISRITGLPIRTTITAGIRMLTLSVRGAIPPILKSGEDLDLILN